MVNFEETDFKYKLSIKIIFGKLIDIRCILVNLINRVYICVYIKVILILININYLIKFLLFLSSILIFNG